MSPSSERRSPEESLRIELLGTRSRFVVMRFRALVAIGLFLSACVTSVPGPKERVTRNPRTANLQRAAKLPWRDGGRCVVQEASQSWSVVAERCFQALDHDRVRFHDPTGRCTVASTDAAAMGLGICVLAAPELAVGAVIIIGAVVVAVAIKEELDAYELRQFHPEETRPTLETKPAPLEPMTKRRLKPEPSGQDWLPPVPNEPPERKRRPECKPVPAPHLGGNALHNKCADRVPLNSFPGWDVLVNGKHFDALQLATRTLWEVKTNGIETYSPYVRRTELDKQVEEAKRERALAVACGYRFVIGVRTEAHKAALLERDPTLAVIVMDWC